MRKRQHRYLGVGGSYPINLDSIHGTSPWGQECQIELDGKGLFLLGVTEVLSKNFVDCILEFKHNEYGSSELYA